MKVACNSCLGCWVGLWNCLFMLISISMDIGFEHWQSNELPFSNFSPKWGTGGKKTVCHIGYCLCERMRPYLPQQLKWFLFSCYSGSREASDELWSTVSGGYKARRSCLGSHHYPWENHGPVSCCSKICQDAVLGETTWLSTLHHCHCGYSEREGMLFLCCLAS